MSAEKRKKKEKKEKKDKKKKKKEKRHRKSESSAEDDVIVDSGVASKRRVVAKKNKSVQVRWLLFERNLWNLFPLFYVATCLGRLAVGQLFSWANGVIIRVMGRVTSFKVDNFSVLQTHSI